ncbi:MAG: Gfo/Idh/MocA family oxidoreductase [Acidobacteria bacterium]|nr:Gfo/Idh/MocA family oxidoreductase [Acidobacteriota bacterium]
MLSRRTFLKKSSLGAGAFTILQPQLVRGAGQERLKAGLVGCGGRGTQAVVDLLTGNENVELVAMADVFEDKLEGSIGQLRDPKYITRHAGIVVERNGKPTEMKAEDLAFSIQGRIKVDPEHHFVGFEAYQKLVASDLDIVMLCTPPGYRPMHFEAAVEAKKHVFTEKPIATDPVGTRRFMAAAKKAEALKLTVMSGAQRRSQREYIETIQKIHDGAIGDVLALYAYYLSGPVFHAKGRDEKWGDMEWEHRNWYSFVWICGDQIVEQHFHNLDFMNWLMGTHPERVVASGGIAWRPREELYGNIYDHMSSDFIYPNGVHLTSHCRQYPSGVYHNVSDLVVGAKGRSTGLDLGTKGINPYVQEHIDMVKSIRGEGPYINHGMAVAESTMTAIMGRESAYSGQEITWDQAMASQLDLMPKAFGYDQKMEAAPLPVPGVYKFS